MPSDPPAPPSQVLKRRHAWLGELNTLLGAGPLQSSLESVGFTLHEETLEEATGGLWGAIERAWRRLLARLTVSDALDAPGVAALIDRLDDLQARIDRWRKVNERAARLAREQVRGGDLRSVELARRLDEVEALEPAVAQHGRELTARLGWLEELDRVVDATALLTEQVEAWGPPPAWSRPPPDFEQQALSVEEAAADLARRLEALPRTLHAESHLDERLAGLRRTCRAGRLRARTLRASEEEDLAALTEITAEALEARLEAPEGDGPMRGTDPLTQAYVAVLDQARAESAERLPPPGVHPGERDMRAVVELAQGLPPEVGLGSETPEVGAPRPEDTPGSKRLAGLVEQAAAALVAAVDHLPPPVEALCRGVWKSEAPWDRRRTTYGDLLGTHWQIPLLMQSLAGPLRQPPKSETERGRADRAARLAACDDLQAALRAVATGGIPSTARTRRMTPAVVEAIRAAIEAFDARLEDLEEAFEADRSDTRPKTGAP